jgi:hypothetical protein
MAGNSSGTYRVNRDGPVEPGAGVQMDFTQSYMIVIEEHPSFPLVMLVFNDFLHGQLNGQTDNFNLSFSLPLWALSSEQWLSDAAVLRTLVGRLDTGDIWNLTAFYFNIANQLIGTRNFGNVQTWFAQMAWQPWEMWPLPEGTAGFTLNWNIRAGQNGGDSGGYLIITIPVFEPDAPEPPAPPIVVTDTCYDDE